MDDTRTERPTLRRERSGRSRGTPAGPGAGRLFLSESVLLLTAAIWGFAFVAQRVAMEHVGPFTFNAARFALGALVTLPLLIAGRGRTEKRRRARGRPPDAIRARGLARIGGRSLLSYGLAAGTLIFLGAACQQVGLVYTTAGKAGFITGLYVVVVPILGLIWRHRPGAPVWAGAILAAVGLGLLSAAEGLAMAPGDALELAGAFFWAGHVLLVGWLSPRIRLAELAFVQFATCAGLSLATALFVETIKLGGLVGAAVPILYGGLVSVGIAYTLQLVGQRRTPPAHAAIIMSLEAVFAAIGGRALLGEVLSGRALVGCALMLAGVVVSQWRPPGIRNGSPAHR